MMLYDAVCHANLHSVIHYPYPIRIRGIVENDIHIYPYPQKFTDIRKYLSAHLWRSTLQESAGILTMQMFKNEIDANFVRVR